MSENVARTCHDGDGVTKQAVNSNHQSVWMAHWMSNTGCKPTAKQACGRLSTCNESHEEDGHDSKRDHLVAESEKSGNEPEECENRLSEVAETKVTAVRFVDEKLRSSFPMFNLQSKRDGESARRDDRASSSHWESIKPQSDHNDAGYQLFSLGGSEKHLRDLPPMIQWVRDTKTPSRENPVKADHISENQAEIIAENSELAKDKSAEVDFVVSSSKVVPYGFGFGKTLVRSLHGQEEVNRSNSILESGQRVTNTVYHSNSVFLVHDKAVSNPFEKSRNPMATYNFTQLLPRDPSTSRSQEPEFVSKQYESTQHSGIGFFPSKNNPMDLTGSEKYHGCMSLPSPQCRMNDVGAVRTCTTMDSMKEFSGAHKKFSTSTTHHLLFSKADFNLPEGGRMLKESIVSTKLKKKYSSEPVHFNQDIAFPIKSGVKLQLLGSPMGSEEEKDAQELKTSSVNIRHESSSETNTMDLDTFRKNHVSGVVSSSSNKWIELEQQTPTSQATLDSVREIGGISLKRKLPDINQQPNDFAVNASSGDTSTSRTQSLDAKHLLSNAEQLTNFKFNTRPVGLIESEPSRWLKRLKTSPSSASGTQSSKMGEDSSHEKVNNIFSKIMKFTMNRPDPITDRSRGKQPEGLGPRANLLSTKSPSADSVRRDREVTLSHPWIRRLCCNAVQSSNDKSKAASGFESQRSKPSMSEPENKQFPSLVAMALIGRALMGYNPCKIRRKGSLVVWRS